MDKKIVFTVLFIFAAVGLLSACTTKSEDASELVLGMDASEETESFSQRTELVYGMVGGVNADSTSVIWNAIATFNQQNEDYYVTIKNYDGNLDRLHADMTAGKGPDIIDMTYSEYYESYVKNGYLEDLTPYLEQSQYSDDIIWNVLDAYKINDGLYMFVPQFLLKGILIQPDYEAEVEEWNMETFLALMEENQWEMDLFGAAGDPENLLRVLLYGRQEEFLDWENGEAYFDTEAFKELLELCMEYAQAGWPDATDWTYAERERNTLYKSVTYGKMFASYLFYADTYGREYSVYGYPTLSGQTYGVEACSASCAIYSLSGNKEGAWEFIESLLWESNQKYSGFTDPGFPVRKSVLEELAKEAGDEQIASRGELLTITESEISILTDIIYNGNFSRTSIERDIWAIISEETAAYFAGEKAWRMWRRSYRAGYGLSCRNRIIQKRFAGIPADRFFKLTFT
ncbi:MAG: ABC transporter substrate-binding protein [Lachnospiraceae bacterium]|nr:ABC transporter substrate-binding protein [Lachnospiraceae bacterium]